MTTAPTVLIVDDEALIRWSLRQRLEETGHRVVEASCGREAELALGGEAPDLVLLDQRLPDSDGLTLLRRVKARDNETLVILMTAYSSVESAVEAMKMDAYHYLIKPFSMEEMLTHVKRALETKRLWREVKELRAQKAAPFAIERIIGRSEPMVAMKALLRRIAESPASTVLLQGESGTGKDVAARSIHYASARITGPFVNITCSAMPEALLESELFGHEKGAFTDARDQKKGLFQLAHGGTVFLDEIGEMTPSLQSKLLRFLEEKTFKRVGGVNDVTVDVRVIAATNRNLEQEVARGRFREDLYYRLRVLPLLLPPLREREGDVPLLTAYFLDAFNREFRKRVQGVSKDAAALLEAYPWPGNVRELKNAAERAVLLSEGTELGPADFLSPIGHRRDGGMTFQLPARGVDIERVERELVSQALERTSGNRTRAAKLLGLNRDQIRYRIQKFGLGHLTVAPEAEGELVSRHQE